MSWATSVDMKERLQSYIDAVASGDVDRVMEHYAPNATCEDPVGGPIHRGLEQIRAFYTDVMTKYKLLIEPVAPICSTVDGMVAMSAKVELPEGTLHFVETQAYSAEGKIVQMRAYYNFGDLIPR